MIGGAVDASNGSMNSLYPRPLNVKLVADGSSDEAVLLDKKGETIATVAAHNAKVMADVEKGLAEQQAKADKKAAKKEPIKFDPRGMAFMPRGFFQSVVIDISGLQGGLSFPKSLAL